MRRPVVVLLAVVGIAVLVGGAVVLGAGNAEHDEPDRASPSSTDAPAAASTTALATTSTSSPPPTDRAATGTCPAVPRRPPPPEDRPRYDVDLVADPRSGSVEGEATVRFRPDLAVDHLVFRLWANGPRPAATGTHIDVLSVRGPAGPLATSALDPTTLRVELPAVAEPGEEVVTTVAFRLTVPGTNADRISRSGDSLRLGSVVPLLPWEPGVGWATDPPTAAFAEAVSSPAADWVVGIEVPDGYSVLAGGRPGPDGRWRIRGARDFAASVGRFTLAEAETPAGRANPVEVTVGVHGGVGEDPAAYRDRVVAALEALAARYGAYPWPTYTLAITPGLSGGIEFPAHVMQGPGSIGRTTPHEVAHMWFYGLVGNNQARDPWLDEGLATWAEARLEGTLGAMVDRSVPPEGQGRAGAPMTYWEPRRSAYYRSVYVQSAAALAHLGDPDLVDCALAHYVAGNAWRTATPEDLMAELEALFPDPAAALAPFGLP